MAALVQGVADHFCMKEEAPLISFTQSSIMYESTDE